jgi:hypothetical protein
MAFGTLPPSQSSPVAVTSPGASIIFLNFLTRSVASIYPMQMISSIGMAVLIALAAAC